MPERSDHGSGSPARRRHHGLGAIALLGAPMAQPSSARPRRVPRALVGVSLLVASPPRRRGLGVGVCLTLLPGGAPLGAAAWSAAALAARCRQLSSRRAGVYTVTHTISRCRNRLGPGSGAGLQEPATASSDSDAAGSDDGDGSPSESSPRGDGPHPRGPRPTPRAESLLQPFEPPAHPPGQLDAVPGQPTPTAAAPVATAPATTRSVPHVDAWLVAPDTASQRVADTRRQPMRLSALFEEFCHYLRVEKEAAPRTIETYRWCFRDYESFVMKPLGGTVLGSHFTADTCLAYQYDLAARGLQTSSIRVRLATLGSFGKWAARRDKIARNPVDVLTRPRRKVRLPRVPRWETVESVLAHCTDERDKALVALMCFGGLRRSEIVALDVGDVAPGLGLRRVQGKGGVETVVPLPTVAQDIVARYIAAVRANAKATDPLFVSRFKTKGGHVTEVRMTGHRVWKITKTIGARGRPRAAPARVPPLVGRPAAPAQWRESPRGTGAPPARGYSDHHPVYAADAVRSPEGDQRVRQEDGDENRDSHPSPHGT